MMPRPWPSACTRGGASCAVRLSRWAYRQADRQSSHPGGCNGLPNALLRVPVVGTWLLLVRCRLRWPASSRLASWRCCASSGTRCASTATVIGAWLSLLTVEERRREGRRNLPNVVRIVAKEWTTWLARGGRASRPAAEPLIGVKKITPTDRSYKNQR